MKFFKTMSCIHSYIDHTLQDLEQVLNLKDSSVQARSRLADIRLKDGSYEKVVVLVASLYNPNLFLHYPLSNSGA